MARKQVSIQDTVETNEDFEEYLHVHAGQLICMEVYTEFCGYCLATGNAIRKGKLELGQDRIAMVKALSDNITVLSRFKGKSEPVFLFIVKGKITRAMFGANGIELCRIIEEELNYFEMEKTVSIRPHHEISEVLPEESAKMEIELRLEEEHREATNRLRVLTLAARKKRVCNRMAVGLNHFNYIMFWPHCHQAHVDLYEKWDPYNISVAAKDTFQLTEDNVKEALYMSDIDPNEACLHALLKGEVLVVVFKMLDSDTRSFVRLLRYALYEEIPIPKDDVPPEKQVPPIPAFERYASISKTLREVRRDRYEARMQKLREEKEERERLAAEQARMAREAEEERLRLEKQRAEEEKMARMQAGLPAEPDPPPKPEPGEGDEELEGEEKRDEDEAMTDKDVEAVVEEEEHVEAEEEFHSDIEIEGEEYIPPGGLFVPGLYAPLNELAKANGLAFFYPGIVSKLVDIETEHIPPHVCVIFAIDKRNDVLEVINQYRSEILAVGVFAGDDPFTGEHVAYTIKQYNGMERIRRHKDRLALMVSRKRSLPLLQLAILNPIYISSDPDMGERDCLQLFPVGYGDEYEEIVTVVEEEAVVETVIEQEPEIVVEEPPKNEDDEEEEED